MGYNIFDVDYSPNEVDYGNPGSAVTSAQSTQYSPTVSSSSSNQIGYTSSVSTPGAVAVRPNIPAPPTAPNLSNLQGILSNVQRNTGIKKAMQDYDALFAATQASGFQAADSSGSIYDQRLAQAGINPTSGGAVRAQAKMGVYKELEGITKEKSTTRLDAINKSQSLQASIAAQIASIRQAYSSTLADYNIRAAGLDFDLNKFNAGQSARRYSEGRTFDMQERELNARMEAMGLDSNGRASSSGNSGKSGSGGPMNDFYPGYIPNSGPVMPQIINGQIRNNTVAGGWPTSWDGPDTASLGWGTGRS